MSKRTAAETSGMRATPISRPTPLSSRKRTTRSAAWPTSTPGTSHKLSRTGLVSPGFFRVLRPAVPLDVRRGGEGPVLRVGGHHAGVVAGEHAEGNYLLLGALGADLHDHRVPDHRVVDDLALPLAELDDGVPERGALLELLVSVVLVAHAALHLAAAADDLLVRRHALLLGEPDVDGSEVPRPAPRRAAQRQPARVAAARVPRAVQKPEPAQRHLGVVGALEPVLDRPEVELLLVGLVLDLDVLAVEGDVAPYELDARDPVVARELAGLDAHLAPELPVAVLLALVLLCDDAHDVVGFGVWLAPARRERHPPDKVPDLGGDDDPVADAEVEVAGVAEPGYAPARDADVDEPGKGSSTLCRIRDSATSRIASGETLYASAARASPKTSAAPAQSAPGCSSTLALNSSNRSTFATSPSAPTATAAASLYVRARRSMASRTAPSLAALPARLAPSFARRSGSSTE